MRTAVVAFCLVIATSAGGEEAAYRVWGGDSPVEAAANGYTQQVRPVSENMVDVSVSTSFAPIGETSTYGQILTGERPVLPPDFSLPPRLAKLLTPDIDAWEAATVVLIWVARHLQVDGSDPNPQDAVSVLARGRGRCSGVSNAAVALLRAAGFQARTVSGLLIGEGETIPHRWLECRFPNSGWVPSDPTLGLWTITPRHVVFADTVMSVPKVEIIEEGRDGLERLPSREGRLLRPNYGAGLVCRMATEWGGKAPVAVLRGDGGEVRRATIAPEARFSDLLPGRWVLEVEAGGAVIDRRELRLRSGDLRSYTVPPLEPGRSGGTQ